MPGNPDPRCLTTISQGGRAADQTRTVTTWFNPCAFSDPNLLGEFRFGTARRNSLIGPRLLNFDLNLLKRIPLRGEGHRLELRVEVFNLFNHPSFDLPERIFDSPNFGALRSSNAYGEKPPRQVQIGVKYLF